MGEIHHFALAYQCFYPDTAGELGFRRIWEGEACAERLDQEGSPGGLHSVIVLKEDLTLPGKML